MLRLYVRFLIQSYWAQQSAFYLPPATELESALQRLIETDPPNQRIYKLRLAGLAWDRQDDDTCLRLAQIGFDPDVKSGGPIDFSLDPRAPPRTLARMIDIFLRRGDAGKAWNLCQQARTLGYVGTPRASNDPIFEMTCRKVENLSRAPNCSIRSTSSQTARGLAGTKSTTTSPAVAYNSIIVAARTNLISTSLTISFITIHVME